MNNLVAISLIIILKILMSLLNNMFYILLEDIIFFLNRLVINVEYTYQIIHITLNNFLRFFIYCNLENYKN